MRFSDYRRLGKISIASRKKSTKNTVRGISFGLIIIIPIIFFSLSFYLDLTGKINNVRTLSSFVVETKHYNDLTPTIVEKHTYQEYNYGLLAYENLEKMINLIGIGNAIVGEYYVLDFTKPKLNYLGTLDYSKLIYDKIEINLIRKNEIINSKNKIYLNNLLKVCHPEFSNFQYFTDAELADLKSLGLDSPYLVGGGFTGNGQGQIILSETFIKEFNIDANSIIGKQITFDMLSFDEYLIDNNTNPFDDFDRMNPPTLELSYQIIKDYTVVGILSEAVYKLNSRKDEAHLWVTKSSIYDEEGNSFLPITTTHQVDNNGYQSTFNVHTYSSLDFKKLASQANDKNQIFLPIGFGAGYSIHNYTKPVLKTILQFDSFQAAEKNIKIIDAIYSTAFPTNKPSLANETYELFAIFYQTGIIILIILLIFGGIIFFATLLNLYNSILYSVQSRTNYIGLMRAIGAKQRLIPRLYFFEIMLIFLKSSLWIIIFSSGISYLMKFAVDKGFEQITEYLPFTLSLNLIYYPLTLIIVILFEFFIAFLYSEIAAKNVSRKPILEILKDER